MVIGGIASGEKGLPGAEGSASGLHDTPYFQLYQVTTQLVCILGVDYLNQLSSNSKKRQLSLNR
jgi:hypothetical protein